MDLQSLAATVRTLREVRGWSQPQLADKSHMSLRQLQRIERGRLKKPPRNGTLLELAEALGVDASTLRVGVSWDSIETVREDALCPHCGAPLIARVQTSHEYGDGEIDEFQCGFMRGDQRRPCPKSSRFPTFADYDLKTVQRKDGSWSCCAFGKTDAAREVYLRNGTARSKEAAEKFVEREFISARDGYDAAEKFWPFSDMLGEL
jgi:transcriptional regulator with XRE-family HTH domain